MGHAEQKLDDDERVMTLVERALARPSAERRAYLEEACSGDSKLLAEVWTYVEQEERLGGFLLEPLFAPPPDPTSILHYEIVGVLGEGGQAKVYRAWDKNLKRHVALKLLPPHLNAGSMERARFFREATAVSALDHPNIAVVHAIEETAGRLFIVMPCYEGETLRQRIRKGPLPVRDAVNLALQIARGLAAAHAAGVVHRDLKPSNAILTTQGAVKIIDFGVAQVETDTRLTETGMRIGTMSYMSPEQATGELTDHRSDIWALGVVLFEMLMGYGPFRYENQQKVLFAIVNNPVPPMRGIASPIQAVVQKALAKQSKNRYQSTDELIRDLEVIEASIEAGAIEQQEPATLTLPGLGTATPGQKRTHRFPLKIAGFAAGMAVAALAATWLAGHQNVFRHVSRPKNYVAVVPFQTSAIDPAQRALASGLGQAVTDSLSRYESANHDFLVVPSADVQAQRVTDVAGASKAFSVRRVLTGQMLEDGGHIRLSLTLVDALRQQPAASVLVEDTEDHLPALYLKVAAEAARMVGLPAAADNQTEAPGAALGSWLRGSGYLERFDRPGNLEAATAEFENALKAGSDPLLLVGLSLAYRIHYDVSKDSQWIAKASAMVDQALQARRLPEAYLSRGAIRNIQGNYKGAVEDFEQARLLGASPAEAYRGIGRAFEGMGLKEQAEATYKTAIRARPGYWAVYNRLGAFYHRQSRYREAVEQFQKVVELTPLNSAGYSNLGEALLRMGDLGAAKKALEKSVSIAPTLAGWSNLGGVLLAMRSFPESAQAYEHALEFNRRSYTVWANLAACYYRTPGQRDKAMDAYRQAATLAGSALKASPSNPTILSQLANYSAYGGDRSEPLKLLSSALALAPDDPDVLVNAAETYEFLGYHNQAVFWLRKALEHNYPRQVLERAPGFDELLKDPEIQKLTRK